MIDPRLYLKENLVPRIRKLGFKGSFPHFRRYRDGRNELLTFQFDKYGTGKFVIEIAVAPQGDFTTFWGKVIPAGRLTAHDLGTRLRLGTESTQADNWFEFSSNPDVVIDQILSLIESQSDEYYRGMPPPNNAIDRKP